MVFFSVVKRINFPFLYLKRHVSLLFLIDRWATRRINFIAWISFYSTELIWRAESEKALYIYIYIYIYIRVSTEKFRAFVRFTLRKRVNEVYFSIYSPLTFPHFFLFFDSFWILLVKKVINHREYAIIWSFQPIHVNIYIYIYICIYICVCVCVWVCVCKHVRIFISKHVSLNIKDKFCLFNLFKILSSFLIMAYERCERARDNFRKFISQFQPKTKRLLRKFESILNKLYRKNFVFII